MWRHADELPVVDANSDAHLLSLHGRSVGVAGPVPEVRTDDVRISCDDEVSGVVASEKGGLNQWDQQELMTR